MCNFPETLYRVIEKAEEKKTGKTRQSLLIQLNLR